MLDSLEIQAEKFNLFRRFCWKLNYERGAERESER
jgi:hypothetical protein